MRKMKMVLLSCIFIGAVRIAYAIVPPSTVSEMNPVEQGRTMLQQVKQQLQEAIRSIEEEQSRLQTHLREIQERLNKINVG